MQSVQKKLTRGVVKAATFWLPAGRRRQIERWVRGHEQQAKLRRADVVVVSFGKSGRTWLRVLMSRFYQVRDGLPERMLIGFDNFHRKRPAVPRVFFTHDNYLKDYTGEGDSKAAYRGHKVVLLVRHPADVAVSQFFQWRFRMRPHKKVLNDYPRDDPEMSIAAFLQQPGGGMPRVVDFLNAWARELEENDEILVVRYEDLRTEPEAQLARLLDFIGTPGHEAQIAEAVRFASFENMRKLEAKRTFWLSGGRMVPRDRSNPDSYKVRRGKVGGFRDYLEETTIEQVEKQIESTLAPVYGYASARGGGIA